MSGNGKWTNVSRGTIMDRRSLLKTILALPFLSLALPVKACEPDFSTDEGLRKAIESLFAKVNPVLSEKAWEDERYPHITFGLESKEPRFRDMRESLYKAIKYKVKATYAPWRNDPPSNVFDPATSIMQWRQYPISDSSEGDHTIRMRLSWQPC